MPVTLDAGATQGTSGEQTVNEDEWLDSTDPQKMLEFLSDKASDRNLSPFVAACSGACLTHRYRLPDTLGALVYSTCRTLG
jgi:hypothetical protein